MKKLKHITEDRFPHIIEIAIPASGLDAQTSRSIVNFHDSRKIQIRFGHGLKSLSRWCFSDAATAEAFKQQFGGNHVVKNRRIPIKRTVPSLQSSVHFEPHRLSCNGRLRVRHSGRFDLKLTLATPLYSVRASPRWSCSSRSCSRTSVCRKKTRSAVFRTP